VFHARFVAADRVLTAADDHSVRLWRLVGDELVGSEIVARLDEAVSVLEVEEDRFVATSIAGEVVVGSLEHPSPLVALERHANGVWSASFTPCGKHVITASQDATARMTHVDGRGVARVFEGHPVPLLSMAIDRAGRWLATGSYDGSVRLWDLERPRLDIPLEGHGRQINSVQFDRNGERIVTGGNDGTVRIWSADEGTSLGVYDGAAGNINFVVFGPSGRHLAVAKMTKDVELWDLETGELRYLRGHEDLVSDIAFDRAGERLASASYDGTARIWDVASGRELQVLRGHTIGISRVEFGAEHGAEVVTASDDETVRRWDPSTGELLATLPGTGNVRSLVRSPDGRTLAAGTEDGNIYLFSDDLPEHARVLRGHRMAVWSVAFDAKGERLVTGSFDRSAWVWDIATGLPLATLEGHTEEVWDARFLPDGRVITASDDNTIRVWSLEADIPTLVLSGHQDAVIALAIGPEGHSVASASSDGTARIWNLDLLETNPDMLHARLLEATSFCLPIEQRIRELGLDASQAEASFMNCERRHGR
jgi:WD40 repeat protein